MKKTTFRAPALKRRSSEVSQLNFFCFFDIMYAQYI